MDRLLGILLVLQSQRTTTAGALARRFGVVARTIYRDLHTLSALGVPLYSERGRNGGIRLLPGYFLPPLMLTQEEAIALVLGMTLLHSVHAAPFQTAIETATQKLLAAVPEPLRALLVRVDRLLGVEPPASDIFHPERSDRSPRAHPSAAPETPIRENETVTVFLRALLDRKALRIRYRSPYRAHESEEHVAPLGAFWDRDRWYLVGRPLGVPQGTAARRLYRADRVLALAPYDPVRAQGTPEDWNEDHDVRDLLGHVWLREAMREWRAEASVTLRLTPAQADLLQHDWYYRHADFTASAVTASAASGAVEMTYGEGDPAKVCALLRWLGPGAELIAPATWRERVCAELLQMLAHHQPQQHERTELPQAVPDQGGP